MVTAEAGDFVDERVLLVFSFGKALGQLYAGTQLDGLAMKLTEQLAFDLDQLNAVAFAEGAFFANLIDSQRDIEALSGIEQCCHPCAVAVAGGGADAGGVSL